jgi:long-chain acyl-CoA synthetase
MLSHGNLTSSVSIYKAWNRGIARDIGPGSRLMCVLPLFHIYALTAVMLRCFASGALLMLRQRFDADTALDDIERGRCTNFAGVPTMWIALVNHPRIGSADLSSLQVCSSGGAALPPEILSRFAELTGLRIGGGWGMTETSPAGTNIPPDRQPGPGEIGVPLPAVDMDVVAIDDPARTLPPGQTGELRVRGPNVMAGYWQRPDETAAAFCDGWFLTGDIGHMSPDGIFTIVDRKKDMLISGGFNVYPRTIEDAIHEHPDVREAAVIGVPDAYRGQAAKAFVSLRAGSPALTLEALRAFLADKLGRHEMPAALEVRDELPHTSVGKLAKRELMAEIADQRPTPKS